jgi:hypothetical protein
MKHFFTCAIVLAFICAAYSQDTSLYADCEVYGVSAYQADYISGLPESSPSGQIKVYIDAVTKPLVLVCSGYDPMTWKVYNPDSADIRLVILNGWNSQSVTGVDSTAPVVSQDRSTYHSPEYSTSQYSDYKRLEDFVKGKTGKGFTTFQSAGDGMYFHIREPNGIAVESCLLHSVYTYRGAGAVEGYKYHPRGSVTVDIGPMLAPLILQLGSYEPVEWHIANPKQVTIKAVFVNGYYQGKVSNVADSVTLYSAKSTSATTVFPALTVASHQTAKTTGYFYIKHEVTAGRRRIAALRQNGSIAISRSPSHLTAYNAAGRMLKSICRPTENMHIWQRRNRANSMYLLRMHAGEQQFSKKLILIE